MPTKKNRSTRQSRCNRRAKRDRNRLAQASQSSQNHQELLINAQRSCSPDNGKSAGQIEVQEIESSDGDQPGPAPTQAFQRDNMYANKYFTHYN